MCSLCIYISIWSVNVGKSVLLDTRENLKPCWHTKQNWIILIWDATSFDKDKTNRQLATAVGVTLKTVCVCAVCTVYSRYSISVREWMCIFLRWESQQLPDHFHGSVFPWQRCRYALKQVNVPNSKHHSCHTVAVRDVHIHPVCLCLTHADICKNCTHTHTHIYTEK